MSDILNQLAESIRVAAASGQALRIRGGGTKDFYGQTLTGELLDTHGHSGVVDYDPTELVITVRAGTLLADVESTLRGERQILPFEPPHFGGGATIGGAVAAGLSGPRRYAAGAARDFALGVRILDGRGDDLRFGGQVMKNVAGYDVARLMVGTLGTLGVITEVSLKVLPQPVAEETLAFELPADRAIATLNKWAGLPLPLTATAYSEGELNVRLAGATAAVRSAIAKLGGERVAAEAARALWAGIRDHTMPFFAGGAPLWRLSVPTAAPGLGLPGAQLIEWGGGLRWLATHAEARTIRDAVGRVGGHATLFRGGDKSVGVFHPLAPPIAAIHRRLKEEFDPQRILNRGRMYADL